MSLLFKIQKALATFILSLMLKVRILAKTFEKRERLLDFFTGLLFTIENMKKDKVPRRNEMLSLYCTALGFVSKNGEYNPE